MTTRRCRYRGRLTIGTLFHERAGRAAPAEPLGRERERVSRSRGGNQSLRERGTESLADDLGVDRGVVLSRAAASLRSIESKPPRPVGFARDQDGRVAWADGDAACGDCSAERASRNLRGRFPNLFGKSRRIFFPSKGSAGRTLVGEKVPVRSIGREMWAFEARLPRTAGAITRCRIKTRKRNAVILRGVRWRSDLASVAECVFPWCGLRMRSCRPLRRTAWRILSNQLRLDRRAICGDSDGCLGEEASDIRSFERHSIFLP